MRFVFVFAGLIVAARLLGLFTVGVVATASMEPTLPAGSVFLAWRQPPEVGDVVVYRAPSGAVVVHRVVGVVPEGLVTRGDANERADQELGVPPVDPGRVAVVPEVAGVSLAVRSEWLKPLGVAAAQTILLALGLRGVVDGQRRMARPGPFAGLRPHHLVAAAAVLFLVSAPVLSDTVQARGDLQVRGGMLPTHVRVESDAGVAQTDLAPFATASLPAKGGAEVVRAPAVPGTRSLAAYGAVAAMVPMVVVFLGLAGVMRWQGW